MWVLGAFFMPIKRTLKTILFSIMVYRINKLLISSNINHQFLGGVSVVVLRPVALKSTFLGKIYSGYAKRVYLSAQKIYSFRGWIYSLHALTYNYHFVGRMASYLD